MNREQLEEIRARAEAATEGPYELGSTSTIYMNGWSAFDMRIAGKPGIRATVSAFPADAELMISARQDVPALLDEIDRQAQLIKDFTDPDACWFDHHGHCQAHGWTATEPRCPHARAKEALAEGSAEGGTSKDSSGDTPDPHVVAVLDAAIVWRQEFATLAPADLSADESRLVAAVDAMLASRHTLRDVPTERGAQP